MASESLVPGNVEDWLRYARSDLKLARIDRPEGVLLENLCFHAQQAVEKTLKAVLVFLNVHFPTTHNIRTLIDFLPDSMDIPQFVEDSAALTDYAVLSRYPGNIEPVEENEYRHSIFVAEAVLSWAESLICKNET